MVSFGFIPLFVVEDAGFLLTLHFSFAAYLQFAFGVVCLCFRCELRFVIHGICCSAHFPVASWASAPARPLLLTRARANMEKRYGVG